MVWSKNPPEPHAGSTIYSSCLGLSIFTHILITLRGVKYCPFCPLETSAIKCSKARSMISNSSLSEPKNLNSSRKGTHICNCSGVKSILDKGLNMSGHSLSAPLKSSSFTIAYVFCGSLYCLKWTSFSGLIFFA